MLYHSSDRWLVVSEKGGVHFLEKEEMKMFDRDLEFGLWQGQRNETNNKVKATALAKATAFKI